MALTTVPRSETEAPPTRNGTVPHVPAISAVLAAPAVSVASRPVRRRAIYYPESDGKPMAETDVHAQYMMDTRTALELHYRDNLQVYVSGNNFIYFEEGNVKRRVSPDTYVVFGVAKGARRTYRVWDEGGHVPSFVLEITSRKTRKTDVETKPDIYRALGVEEYFLFDPLREYVRPHRLRGYRLEQGEYVPMTPGEDGSLLSVTLGLRLCVINDELRFDDPQTGRRLLTRLETGEALHAAGVSLHESEAARRESDVALRESEAARRESEARAARLEALLAQLGVSPPE